MLRTQISLLGIIFLVVFIEAVVVPGIWSSLRVDLIIGMIIGIIIHLEFSQGLFFVMIVSLLLQAFSGARPGLVPLVYLGAFLVLELLKGLVYLENVFTQVLLAAAIFALASGAVVLSMDLTFTHVEIIPLAIGAMLTGLASPAMVALVERLKKAYEA